jgi:hypothetical protein
MMDLLNQSGVNLSIAAGPMLFFGPSMNQPSWHPTAAIDCNGRQTPSSSLCDCPNASCTCRHQEVPISNLDPRFPVYYTYQKCTDVDIRVAYNLFYQKDGFASNGISGHP